MSDPESAGDRPAPKRPHRDFDARARAARTDFELQMRARKAEFDARNEVLTARTGRNLPAAIGVGLLFAGVMLGSLLVWTPAFMAVAAFLIGMGVYELASAMRFSGRDVPRIPSVIAGIAIVPAAFFGGPETALLTLLGGIVLVSIWRLVEVAAARKRPTGAELLLDLTSGLFVQSYVTLLGACVVLLSAERAGALWVVGFIIVVAAVDTGAYATGLTFGKHPMAPRISPKKTWEGFGGSVLASVIAGVLVAWLMLGQGWWFGVILGLLITASGTVGDLTESMIKRDLGIKDISSFLPGHGGLLDRMDSVLPSGAVALMMFLMVH
ncbi:phosphatidate cytidylyltransferase [Curtobacterium ammoniigenes]|uniref:phosphatidate cytidylyltransferase n=1 Tax=Curtobacterium ammoniigenes TaxID=395387 RepID=UPI00082AED70|nr:phosphatidate cytidylyltransferase [Curtobacterium ammoniigenes]